VTVDLTAHTPYRVLGGTLGGDIYTGPFADERWGVTFGTVGVPISLGAPPDEPTPAQLANNSLIVEAARVRAFPPSAGEAEAKLVDNPTSFAMLAFFWPPATYQGAWTYGQGLFAWFPHVTLFMGWQASPPS
jgi:hypothetical protein